MHWTLSNLSICTLALLLASCRNAGQTGTTKTLDNIGSSSISFDQCSGKGPVHKRAALDHEPHLRAALASVPIVVQNGFFDDLGGKIRITTDASECSQTSNRVDDILSCWQRLPDQRQSVEIILKRSSATKEQYALVRAFGFVYGDILLNRVIPKDITSPVKLSDGPQGDLKDYKSHMAAVFIGELKRSLPEKNLTELLSTLGNLGLPSSVITEDDFQRRWQIFSSLSESIKNNFASRVFAEAFHSQFCSIITAKRACTKYPGTMESFKPYAQDLTLETKESFHRCSEGNKNAASGARLEWNQLNRAAIAERKSKGLDTGAYVNSRIAETVRAKTGQQNREHADSEFSLGGDMLQQLFGLITGGLSGGGGGGGLGGLLSQLLGSLGGVGGGGLGDILGSLGLGDLFGGGLNNIGGADNALPPPDTKLPMQNSGGPGSSQLSGVGAGPLPDSSGGGVASAEEQAGMDATNRYRQSKGKSVLQVDPQMVQDCRKQAQMQAQKGGLTHWLYPAGVARAENIAYGSKSGEYTVMQQWVKSPGHHANIMSNHRFIGIGNFGNQWCQRFR